MASARRRKMDTMMPRPTTTSAAATTSTKKTTTCPPMSLSFARECHEREIDRVQHQLDAHEHHKHVSAHEDTERADGEDDAGDREIPSRVDTHVTDLPGTSCSSTLRSRVGRRASTTAPTTAMTNSTDVASNASR